MMDIRKPRSVRKLVALIRGAFDAQDAQRRTELLNGKR